MPPKQFTIPPVSFPNTPSTAPTTTPSAPPQPHHRHHIPPAPFQQYPTTNPSLPFFDLPSSAATTTTSFPPTLSSSSTNTPFPLFLDEPSLLEELEINPTLIWHKTKSLLNPIRINPTLHSSDPDLSGPFLYYISFSLFQLLAGKVQFGIILGWIAISSVFLYSVLNFLAGRNGNLDLYRCVSVVGYCLMPIVIFSALSLFLPPVGSSVVGVFVAGLFVVWATRVCSRLLAEDSSLGFEEHQMFGCYIVADRCNPVSVNTAMRYSGCTIQAGSHISGVFGVNSRQSSMESIEDITRSFSPLPFALIPDIPDMNHTNLDWDEIISNAQSENAINLLHMPKEKPKIFIQSVKFDPVNRCVTLFMPGFEKLEIKLYQFRGGSELLVEARDQRRVIKIPREM